MTSANCIHESATNIEPHWLFFAIALKQQQQQMLALLIVLVLGTMDRVNKIYQKTTFVSKQQNKTFTGFGFEVNEASHFYHTSFFL